jgi:hypothetical protein
MLNNLQAVTGNAKQIGQTAQGMASSIDADRGIIMGQVKGVVKTLESTATTVSSAVATTVTSDVPQMTSKVKAALDDVKKITADAAVDIPPALRSTRIATEDATEITDGVKRTWPLSSVIKSEPSPKALRLDAFEAGK